MVKTEGTDSKKRKKIVDAVVLYAQQNVRVTRSKASKNQDQLERCLTAVRVRQTLKTAPKSAPVYVAAAVDITKGTKGVANITKGIKGAANITPKASITPKLTAAKRCIQRDVANSPNRVEQPNHERVDENINNVDQGSCPSSESSRNTNPSKQKKDFEEFERCLLSLCEEDGDVMQPRQLNLPSSTTQHVENVLPPMVEKTELLEAHSFNFTAMMEDHGSQNDADQAESSIDPALTYVKGYYVKTEVAPMLEQILEKYPGIARGCIFKDPKIAAFMLDMLCSFYQKFKNTGLKDIAEKELEHLTSFVENFQQMGFDVQWIIERLKDISELKRILMTYPTLRDEKLKTQMKEEEVDMLKQEMDTLKQEMDTLKQKMDMLKQKLSVAKAELVRMKAAEDGERYRNFQQKIDDFKAKGLAFWDTSAFYGLL